MHPAALPDDELLRDCDTQRGRTRGPGGQRRNKVETHVTLTHRPTGLQGQAGERRSLVENAHVALRRLRLALAVDVRGPVPRGDIASELWRSRSTPDGRLRCNPEHHDYPALLAEALDVIHAAGCDIKTAALRLGVTPSQLTKLVKDYPPALASLNNARTHAGLHPLH